MSEAHIVFLALATSHLSIIGFYFLLHHRLRQQTLSKLVALLAFSLISYLIVCTPGDFFQLNAYLDILLRRYGNLCALLLWFISYYLFVDHKKISPVVWVLAGYFMIFRAAGSIFGHVGIPLYPIIFAFTYVIPEFVKIGFVVHAIYLAIHGYQMDLVLERRKERIVFIAGTSILLLMIATNTAYLVFGPFINFDWSLGVGQISFISYSQAPIPIIFYSIYLYLIIAGFILWKHFCPVYFHSKAI